ncbi:MAG TPA: hypothetical protein PLO78_08890 [Candidatus Omnitrophota bacterium]|nr:hypothetical protein [Candidatus Omnitrophota bacterium]
MLKKISFVIVLLFALGIFSPVPFSYGEDTFRNFRTVEGSITGISLDQNRVTVRWMMDPINFIYQNVTVDVLPSTIVLKNSEKIEFDDLENGDHVTLKFDPNTVPLPQAISILVVE